MKPFAPSKRHLFELLVMFALAGVFYVFYPEKEGVTLFIFGFIWNWCASIDLDPMFENRRYRFSMLCTVRNIQKLALKPFRKAPKFILRIMRIFPAGLFWGMVVYVNDSVMPWWATFIGSAAFEILRLEINSIKRQKGQV